MNVNNMYKSQLNKVIEHVKLFKFEILKSDTGYHRNNLVKLFKFEIYVCSIDNLKYLSQVAYMI